MINLRRMRTLISYERRLKFRYQKKLSSATRITSKWTGLPHATDNHSQVETGAIELSEVEDAYHAAVEANKAYREVLDKFVKDYGSFHMTYSGTSNLIDDVFNSVFRFF